MIDLLRRERKQMNSSLGGLPRGWASRSAPDKLTHIEIPYIGELVGKTLDAPELKAYGLKVKKFNPANVELKLLSADKTKEFNRYYLHRNKFGGEHRLRAGFVTGGQGAPKNPILVIVVAGDIINYTVPFEFKDLTMP